MSKKNSIYYKYENPHFYILTLGEATARNCLKVKDYFEDEIKAKNQDIKNIFVDLSDCYYMDSTFMGVLLGFNEPLMQIEKTVTIIDISDDCKKLLKEMGMDTLFAYSTRENNEFPERMIESEEGYEISVDSVIHAHETLSSVSPENKSKFKSLLNILRGQKKTEK